MLHIGGAEVGAEGVQRPFAPIQYILNVKQTLHFVKSLENFRSDIDI